MSMFSVKVHTVGGDTLVACCDREMLGRRLTDGELEVLVSERFYGGERLDEERMIRALRDATVANIIGDKAVEAALRHGIVEESGVRDVCGVKHAQVYTL